MRGEGRNQYLEVWLRRVGRELRASGRISEVALLMDGMEGAGAKEWEGRLRRILGREEQPCLEILTRIDAILARPEERRAEPGEEDLFGGVAGVRG